ncbi:CD5 antigen-like [Sparus aurata]|uniref:CD5 antigen-like n=1 Tax=Sparus aurata TaxID=8175 RepID=UPI0011C1061A|nr:CD5 antigen-like [Sparus aurata]
MDRLTVLLLLLWSSGLPTEGEDSEETVRLSGGSTRCSGILEVNVGKWERVYHSGWTLKDAAIACSELDCGFAVSLEWRYEAERSSMVEIRPECIQSGSALKDCARQFDESYIFLGLLCSDSVRLVNGASLCSGRLEVKSHQSNQTWSSVCEDDVDLQDAEVVCRELGCGAPSVLKGALYGEAKGPMWTKEFQCGGHESGLLDCGSLDSARNTCSPGEAVGLTCSEPIRLVGPSRCAGTLEVKHEADWRPVFHHKDDWDLRRSAAVCRELKCGAPVSVERRTEPSDRFLWMIVSKCSMFGSSLRECAQSVYNSSILDLTCSEPLWLSGGSSRCAGTLEVNHDEDWRPVSDYDSRWTLKEAAVACGELDCGSAVSVGRRNESSDIPVWTIGFDCVQSGSVLNECVESSNSSSILDLICSGLLLLPNISVSSSKDGVSKAQQQGFQVSKGSTFNISCSVLPQYLGGSFHLTFTSSSTTRNYTQPAVNHSAHFLFPAAKRAHQGSYSCVYHLQEFSHDVSFESRALAVTVSGELSQETD